MDPDFATPWAMLTQYFWLGMGFNLGFWLVFVPAFMAKTWFLELLEPDEED